MANSIVKKRIGILCYVLVKAAYVIFTTNFMIIDYEVDFDVPIILRRTFLSMGRSLDDMRWDRFRHRFRLNDEQITFNKC